MERSSGPVDKAPASAAGQNREHRFSQAKSGSLWNLAPVAVKTHPMPYSSVSGLTSSCKLLSHPALSIDRSNEKRFVLSTRLRSIWLRTEVTMSASGLSDLTRALMRRSCAASTRSHLLIMTTS